MARARRPRSASRRRCCSCSRAAASPTWPRPSGRRCRCSSRARPPAPSPPPSSARPTAAGDLLAFDMGGTTAKLSLVDGGEPLTAYSFEAARQRRFIEGSGLPIRISTIELIEIGAGGGSIARVDEIGLLKVGPRSAGSQPGPACLRPRRARAHGDRRRLPARLPQPRLLRGRRGRGRHGGRARRDRAAGRGGSGSQSTEVAWGIHDIVNENMAGAARVHIAERGRDPRDYALLCTGGAGPVHAYSVARKLGLGRVICPPSAGVASALGLLVAPARVDRVATVGIRLDRGSIGALEAAFARLEDEARAVMADTGLKLETATVTRLADGRFLGQGFDLVVPLPDGPYDGPRAPGARALRGGLRDRVPREVRADAARRARRVHQHPRGRARAGRGQRRGARGAPGPGRARRAQGHAAARTSPRRTAGWRPRSTTATASGSATELARARGGGGGGLDAGGRPGRDRGAWPPSGNIVVTLAPQGERRQSMTTRSTPSRSRCCGRASSRSWTRRPRPSCAPRSPRSPTRPTTSPACSPTRAATRWPRTAGSIPSFIGTLPATVRHFLRELGAGAAAAGRRAHHQRPVDGHRAHERRVPWSSRSSTRGRLVAFSATTARTCRTSAGASAPSRRARCSRRASTSRSRKLIREGRADDTLIAAHPRQRAHARTRPWATSGPRSSANELMENRVRRADGGLRARLARGARRRALRAAPSARCARPSARCPTAPTATAFDTDGVDAPFDFKRRAHGRRRRDRGRLHRHLAAAAARHQLRDRLHVRHDRVRDALRAPARPAEQRGHVPAGARSRRPRAACSTRASPPPW